MRTPCVAGEGEPQRVAEMPGSFRPADVALRATWMTRLVAVSETLRGTRSVEAAAAAIGRALRMLTDAPRAAVFVRAQDGVVTCPWSHNLSSEYLALLRTPEGVNPWGHLSRYPELACMELPKRGRTAGPVPALLPDVRRLPAGNDVRRMAEREGIRAVSSWPLSRGGRVFAAVAYYFDAPHVCEVPEREVVLAFTLQASAALENSASANHEPVRPAHARRAIEFETARIAAGLEQVRRALDAEATELTAAHSHLAGECARLSVAVAALADRPRASMKFKP